MKASRIEKKRQTAIAKIRKTIRKVAKVQAALDRAEKLRAA